mmetsp:Transcript_7337/g.15737  ORF Transcript_7337/g.15737 Transcript_7337/m.15737 type:complete len:233 (-) Transcript_7337:49-747(-)
MGLCFMSGAHNPMMASSSRLKMRIILEARVLWWHQLQLLPWQLQTMRRMLCEDLKYNFGAAKKVMTSPSGLMRTILQRNQAQQLQPFILRRLRITSRLPLKIFGTMVEQEEGSSGQYQDLNLQLSQRLRRTRLCDHHQPPEHLKRKTIPPATEKSLPFSLGRISTMSWTCMLPSSSATNVLRKMQSVAYPARPSDLQWVWLVPRLPTVPSASGDRIPLTRFGTLCNISVMIN